MGITMLTNSSRSIYGMYRGLVTPPKASRKESFTEAVSRLGVTERNIKDQLYYYKMTSSIYGLFLLFGVFYNVVLYYKGSAGAVIMGTAYCFLIGSFFFRESFWYMQIKKRKLGMSMYDWCKFITGQL
jgi:intracellular multiplication protein IcmV